MQFPDLANDDPVWEKIFEQLYVSFSAEKLHKVPGLMQKYGANKYQWFTEFVRHHGIDNDGIYQVLSAICHNNRPHHNKQDTNEKTDKNDATVNRNNQDHNDKPNKTDKTDDHDGEANGRRGKKRRGKPRCRPGSSDRRWKKLEQAMATQLQSSPRPGTEDGGST